MSGFMRFDLQANIQSDLLVDGCKKRLDPSACAN